MVQLSILGVVGDMSMQQPMVALSSTKSEYMLAFQATHEVMWLRTFLLNLVFIQMNQCQFLQTTKKYFPH